MQLTNLQNIGTTFKKENIFLATLLVSKEDTKRKIGEVVNDQTSEGPIVEGLMEKLVKTEAIALEEPDVFYKDENGYTRFDEHGPETFVGDNSDGKGIIRNIVPVWDYYSENELKEALVNGEFFCIAITNIEPLERYNNNYNK